jgi:hypothetical protein
MASHITQNQTSFLIFHRPMGQRWSSHDFSVGFVFCLEWSQMEPKVQESCFGGGNVPQPLRGTRGIEVGWGQEGMRRCGDHPFRWLWPIFLHICFDLALSKLNVLLSHWHICLSMGSVPPDNSRGQRHSLLLKWRFFEAVAASVIRILHSESLHEALCQG